LGILGVVLAFFSGLSSAQAAVRVCDLGAVRDYAAMLVEKTGADLSERQERDKLLREKRHAVARDVFDHFLRGQIASSDIDFSNCLSDASGRGLLMQSIQATFLTRSLDELKERGGPKIRGLLQSAGAHKDASSSILFRLSGDFFGQAPSEFRAGAHRATGEIYIDISRVMADEWFVLLLHELSHYVDDRTFAAVERFSDRAALRRLQRLLRGATQLDALSRDDQQFINAWVLEGLHRGLLSEYRAWAATDVLYREGLSLKLWGRLTWLDELTGVSQSLRDRHARILSKLLDTHVDPIHEGYFASPVVREAYERAIKDLQASRVFKVEGTLSKIAE
jgi:hypothetical protein